MRIWLAMLVVAGLGRSAAAEPLNSTAFGSTDLSAFDDAAIYGGLIGPNAERMIAPERPQRRAYHPCMQDGVLFRDRSPEPSPWAPILAILVALVVTRAGTRIGELGV